MRAGTQGDAINPWGVRMFRTLEGVEPKTAVEQSAYDKWLDQTSAREEARLDRIHGAVGVIPSQLWIVLFFIAGVIFVFVADVDWTVVALIAAGSIVGGQLGATVGRRLSPVVLRVVIVVVGLVALASFLRG